jgi:hypothetical protein
MTNKPTNSYSFTHIDSEGIEIPDLTESQAYQICNTLKERSSSWDYKIISDSQSNSFGDSYGISNDSKVSEADQQARYEQDRLNLTPLD